VREARIHVRHVRDLLKSVGLQDAYASVDCNSLSLLNIITGGNILGQLLSLLQRTQTVTGMHSILKW